MGGGRGRAPPLFFAITCFFAITLKNYKQSYLKELIINNAPLIYVYPNTIKTCLTPNYLLLGRQLLLFSNATSTVAANLTVLSCTTDKINRISNHFGIGGDMIKTKYKNGKVPRHFWRIAINRGIT